MSALGIPDFESLSDCHRRQNEMLTRLQREPFDPALWKGMKECDVEWCAKRECSEACHYGTRRRRLEGIISGYNLFESSPGPVFDVSIVHPVWERPIGRLIKVSIPAAQQWNYRCLRALDVPNLLAIGIFEASVNRELDGGMYWAGEIHQLVAGAKKAALQRAFQIDKLYRKRHPSQKLVMITEIGCLGRQLAYCTKRFCEERRAYISSTTGRQNRRHLPPSSKEWAEYDAWLLGMRLGARTIAFGCSRRGQSFYRRE